MRARAFVLGAWLLAAGLAAWAAEPLETARKQFDAGRYAEAANTLQAALAQSPSNGELLYWLARCYYELKDYDRAVSYAEQAVRLAPQNSLHHLWLGRAYGEKADRDRSFSLARKTRGEFETAVRLDPRNIAARRDLLEFHLDAPWIVGGDQAKAWQQAEAIAALDPIEGRLARAACWRDEKKFDRAEAEYRQVLEAKPARVEPLLEIADYYIDRRNAPAAESVVEAAARAQPGDPRLAYYRGVARALWGDRLAEAVKLLNTYVATVPSRSDYPSPASARVWLGRVYEVMGKKQEAAGEYRAALQLDPNRKAAREGLRRVEKPL